MTTQIDRLHAGIRTVLDFPEPGVAFKDLSPLLADPGLLRLADDLLLAAALEIAGDRPIDAYAGVDSRGFLFASMLSRAAGVGCLLIRKDGKLPEPTISRAASTEYSDVALCLNPDLYAGRNVMLVDDILATGGTAIAAVELAQEAGASVLGAVFLAHLPFLDGLPAFTKATDLPARAVLDL